MNVSKTIYAWVSKLNTNWAYLTKRVTYHRHFHAGEKWRDLVTNPEGGMVMLFNSKNVKLF